MSSKLQSCLPPLMCIVLVACGSPEQRAADHLAVAKEHYEQENYVKARIEAMNAAQIEPRNADVRYLLARIEETEENFQKALGHLQVAIDADPDHVKSRVKLGNYYVLVKAAELATENATIAKKLAPDNPDVRILQARVHLLNEDADAAVQEIDAALAEDPLLVDAIILKAGLSVVNGDADAALRIAGDGIATVSAAGDTEGTHQLRQFRIVVLRLEQRFGEIEADLRALIANHPEDAGFQLALAQLYMTQNRLDEAEVIFRQYVERDPGDPQRRIEFARFTNARHGPEAAEEVLQKFIVELPDSMELLLAQGQLYEAVAQQDEALETFWKIASAEPESTVGLAARNRIVAIKIRQNEPEEARAVVAAILLDDYDNVDALMVRASFAFQEKRFDDVIAALRMVLRVQPDSEHAMLLLARSHRAADSRELAQDAFRRLIRQNPAHPAASNELAEMLALSGDIRMAEEVLRAQLAADPEDRRAATNLIQTLLLQGDVAGAEARARALLDTEEESGLAEYQFGRVMQAKKSSGAAIEAYKAALAKSPSAPAPLAGIVKILLEEDRTDEAITFLRAHLEQYPTQITARLILADVNASLGKVRTAAGQYEEIIALQPNATGAYAALAALYPDDAGRRQNIYQRGISANPMDAALKLLLAAEYERASQVDDAVKTFESLLADDPDHAIAANNLAALLLDYRSDAGSYAQALDLATRFAGSDNAAFLDTLGWAYYRNGDLNKAIRVLELAVAGQNQVAQHQYHLGMALAKANLPERGREALEKSLSLADTDFPGSEDARATLERLTADVTAETVR